MRHGRIWLAVGLLVTVGIGGALAAKRLRWKRFATVTPGAVYRSGQLADEQLDAAIRRLGLKTVVCLAPERVERERAVCERHGIGFRYFRMPADGLGKPEQFAEVVGILRDAASQPVLVHCHAGVARTGAAVALYRVAEQGWSAERALAELQSFERRGFCTPELQEHVRSMAGALAARETNAPR